MAFEQQLPNPTPSVIYRVSYPPSERAIALGAGQPPERVNYWPWTPRVNDANQVNQIANWASSLGGGARREKQEKNGVLGVLWDGGAGPKTVNVEQWGFEHVPGLRLGDGTGINPGASSLEACRVMIWRVAHAFDAGQLYSDPSTMGFGLSAYNGTPPGNGEQQLPGGATPTLWAAIGGADAGGGVQGYAYEAYDGALVTETVAVPSAAVADVEDWSMFEFELRSAASGRPARLRVRANGVEVASRDVGTAELVLPDDVRAGAFALTPTFYDDDQTAVRASFMKWELTFGIYDLDGLEVGR